LLEALLGHGRWAGRHDNDPAAALAALQEAFNIAKNNGYRLYEVDIRIAIAWTDLKSRDVTTARTEAERAHQMSLEMGYHWGIIDAGAVIAKLNTSKHLSH
jgi:hypothetical protein